MKFKEFIKVLKENSKLELVFEYAKNQFTKPSYHLTEVKNIHYHSVDCGGKSNKWEETHIQLWESPKENDKREYLTVTKFYEILERVDSINTLWLDTEVKIEFGNENFHTSIMDITDFNIKSNQLIVKLFSVKTECKAISEIVAEDSCCSETNSNACC